MCIVKKTHQEVLENDYEEMMRCKEWLLISFNGYLLLYYSHNVNHISISR